VKTQLSIEKGIDFLIKASEDIKNQCMVVLGEGHTKYENFFSDLAKVNPD
jgi:glycogen synthase